MRRNRLLTLLLAAALAAAAVIPALAQEPLSFGGGEDGPSGREAMLKSLVWPGWEQIVQGRFLFEQRPDGLDPPGVFRMPIQGVEPIILMRHVRGCIHLAALTLLVNCISPPGFIHLTIVLQSRFRCVL